jgi:filamentous hemagglutinin family protein
MSRRQPKPLIVTRQSGTQTSRRGSERVLAELPVRIFIDRTSLRVSAALLSILMTLSPVLTFAQSVPAGVNTIIPDGRTATTVTTSGSTSTVTTNTISGSNAFNSYSRFEIGKGATGNLILPNGTSNLINLVNGSTPTTINGTLNAYKNGQIGGNVYFADPNGFVIGKSGVVNVGALNVTTPTREFMDSMFGAGGQINQGAVNNLLAGTIPISPDGNIRIRGRVNAVDAVRLTGQNVSVGSSDASRDQAYRFGSTVNSKGLNSANKIVVRNGSIQIVAANNAKINGGVVARRGGTVSVKAGNDVTIGAKGKIVADSKTGAAGSIAVNAGRDIKIAGYGTLSAKSTQGEGGTIVVLAQRNLTVSDNAIVDVSSAQSNAGFVELSAKGNAGIGAINVNLSAPNGVAGTLLIDPYDLTIGNNTPEHGSSDDYTTSSNIVISGGNVVLSADNSITIAAGFYIDTRNFNHAAGTLSTTNASLGDSGTVTLTAPTITINGSILTNVINTGTNHYNAGDVTLTASVSKSITSSGHTAETKIIIGTTGIINASTGGNSTNTSALAGNIALAATSNSTNESGEVIANADISISGTLNGLNVSAVSTSDAEANYSASALTAMALIGQTLAASVFGVNGGYVAGTARATVKVLSGANITATGNVTLNSSATEVAANPAMVLGLSGVPWGAAATVGFINAEVETSVASGATVSAGSKLTAQATNDATLAVSALVVTSGSIVDATVAVSKVRVDTTANIAAGATISAGGISVLAANTNSFSTSSTVVGIGAGSIGASIAYTDIATHATANLGASVTIASTGNNADTAGIDVEALSNTTKMVTSSSVSLGTNMLQRTILGLPGEEVLETILMPLFGSALPVKLAGAVSYTSSDQTATATIGNGVGVAPTISTPGDVTVVSLVIDRAIRTNADSGATATAKDSNGTLVSVNAAVSYADFTHSSSATIGHGANITARNIGVNAKTDLPNENDWVQSWTHWQTPSDIFSHLNGNAGVVNNILTSYSNASGSGSQNLAVAGSVNFFSVNNETTAWVATDAHLTQTGSAGTWHTGLSNDSTIDWAAAVTVSATTNIQTIDVAGNFGVLLTGTQGAGSGVGGSLNLVFQNNRTVAGIAAGAVVSSTDQVAVSAYTDNVFFAVAPTSGVAGGSVALNGIVSYASLGDFTHASIDNTAQIRAPTVTIKATESLSVITVAGAVAQGAANAVGIANAVLDLTGDTAAYIGANRTDNANDTSTENNGSIGFVHTDALSVQAVTTGRMTSASIAAVEADPASSFKSFALQMLDGIQNLNASVVAAVREQAEGIETAGKAVEKTVKAKPPSFSIDIAGSTSVNLVDMDTAATISSASDISKYSTSSTATTDVLVEALNNTIIGAGSGSASFNFSGASTSVAVAGAIAIDILSNNTKASIVSSTITTAGQVTVRAMSSGSETAVGLGIAASAPTGTSGAASLSASIGIITDSVDASIKYSTITGNSNAPASDGQVVVQSYQQTDIGIGAGALYFAGSAGVGLSVTYASIGDPSATQAATNAAVYSTAITQVQNVTVAAGDTARIAAGAAAGGGGPDANGLAGAIVISSITNSTTASISADPLGPRTISVSGSVSVTADSAYNAALAALLSLALTGTNASAPIDTGIDFGGGELNGGVANSLGASIMAVAGSVQAGDNNIGASIVASTILQTHSAVIEYAYVTAGSTVTVTATDATKIVGVAVGAGLSTGTFAGVASIVTNITASQMLARIGTSSDPTDSDRTTIQANDVNVRALNLTTNRGGAGSLGIGIGDAAVGLSVVTNKISDNVTAIIAGGRVYANHDINVQSASTANILTVAIGVAVAETVGIAGSIAVSIASTNVTASIDNADVKAQNNVAVLAQNDDNIAVTAGATGIGLDAAGIGLSVVTNFVSGSTIANVSNSTVDAFGAGSGTLTVNTGTLNNNIVLNNDSASNIVPPGLSEQTQSVHGLAVVGTSHQTVTANALTLGIAFDIVTAGIAVVPVTNVMGGLTSATISNSSIDTRLAGTNAPDVVVTASSKSFAGNAIIAGGFGGFGGAAANVSNQLDRTTIASISGTNIGTSSAGYTGDGPSVAVTAKATQAAADKVIGFAAGLAGAASSGIINVFSADTEAYVDRGIINAKQLQVTADSTNAFYAVAGAGAAGVGIGIAAAYAISDSENTTIAYVGDNDNVTTINLKGRLAINAVSTNTFDSSAVGGALAGGEGYAGMVNAIAMSNVTRAGLYRANVTTLSTATQSDTDANGQAVNNPAGVQVTATETITVRPTTGSGAVGFQGEGDGSATNVVALGSQVVAESANSQINVPGAVVINAVSNKNVNAQTVTFGVGSSRGVGAAVGTIVIGNSVSAEAMDLLDHNGSGTLSKLNVLSGGGQNYVLSTSGIAAYQVAANASVGHTASAQEVQDYAQGLYTTLLQNGTPGSSGFVLSTSGIGHYASSALSGTTLTNYNTLTGSGSVQNGVFVLTTAGLASYQSAAAAALHIANPTDAQIQAYANGLYQGYVTTINNYANTQYQTFVSNGLHYVLSAAGITTMRSEAQTALGRTGLTDREVQVYANDRYATLTSSTTGSVVNGALVLNATGFATYLPVALTSAQQTTYASLTSAANGTLSGDTLTLNATGLAVFRAAATTSLGHAASDAEVQTYANTQYQTLSQSVKDYANGQYQYLVSNQDTTTAAQSFSVSGALSSVNDGVVASLAGGTTTATAVAVNATSKASTTNMATGVGAGVGYSVGAAVAYTEIGSTVAATISQGTINATTVTATATVADGTGPTATVKSYAGAGALTAAVGASRSDAHINNAVTASLGGTINLTSSGTATASALDTSSVRSDAFGATEAGVFGLGISLADATKTSVVAATMAAASNITGGTAATFNAANTGAVYAGAVAGAGGLAGAGVGAQASATDTSSVTSKVGAGSTVNVGNTGTVTLSATDVPDAKALALGVSVAIGAAVGTSVAEATANPTVLAQIDNSIDAAHATTITAGALNITATGTYNGTTPATDIPASASTPSSTSDFQAGGSNAAAWSVAGSGGYFIAAQGTVATANDNASVTANIGNFANITKGAVGVKANNTTVEVASGLGVAAGGYLSIGVVVVNANANTATSATIGNDVLIGSLSQNASGLTVAANGTDTSTARSTAGAGGTLSGSGATGQTDQDSTVIASIGDRGVFFIGSLTLTGVHTDNYKSIVDSTQAATLGASGATSENHADSTINVGIGQNTTVFASAPSAGMCDVQACAPGVTVLAQNKFNENGTQDSATAAGGGGVNGAGATSRLTITGSANITFGNGAWIFSGVDPVSSPGAISILATSTLTGTDSASLSTGGVIQGAGVNSRLDATLDNNITINDGVVMKSYGEVAIGTYTNSTAGTQALVSTWGAAAVGVADAMTNVTTNQNVSVGNASIFGFDNVYITAGRYGFGYYDTLLNGGSEAHGYVRGLIAVPDATATTNFKNLTTMSLASGGNLMSAQNVYVGGYTGTLTPSANSAGHGYELGFIPVTRSSDVTSQVGTATVVLDGSITAGYYHDLNIVINCEYALSCLTQTSGLPVNVTYASQFNAALYVNQHFDATVATVLLGGISATPVPAFLLGQMYAAGGNVTINASRDLLIGTGTITAYGSPTITVTNNSSAYLVLAGGAYIPDVTGGQILFTGANGSAGTLHTNARPGTVSAIVLNNAFNDGGTTGPALLVAGSITNLGGIVSISNTLGSYGQTANLSAQQLNVYVPNGAVAVSATDPSGMYIVGGFPSTEWDSYIIYPGGKTITTDSATIAANYLANVFYQQRTNAGTSSDPSGDLNKYLYGRENNPDDPSRPGLNRVSEIFLGACAPYTGHCEDGSSEYYFAGSNFFQNITYYALNKTAASFSSANLSGSQSSYQIYGGQVAIKATIININATIVAGRATDYSINLSSGLAAPLITTVTQINNNSGCWWCNNQDVVPEYQTTYSGGELALDRQNYITALATNPGANPIYVVSGTGGLVTYNAATNQLIVANINASSGGGNILLDGKVVSTNTVGRIHLNGGYGNVQINNQTGLDLVLNNINTGNALAASALTSTVKIYDRLNTDVNNTTVYNYTPGVGIKIYYTANGADPLAGASYTLVQSDTTAFNPIVGTRYQWVMQATIGRTVDYINNTTSAWAFTSGTANAPWVFVKSEYINADGSLNMSPASHLSPGSAPQGILINDTSLTSVAFKETITGGVSGISQYNVSYHGCGGDVGSECHYGFIQNGSDYGDWNYNYVTSGWLKLTSSVKADNQIAIDFGGNASGRVNVTSNSNIVVAGTITNPSGTATLTSSRGPQTVFNQTTSNITQTSSNPILTTNLNLVAADAVGTAAKPINATITANSGGTVNAQTGTGDIYLNLNSAAKLGLVWAGDPQNGFKDVNIVASGSLTRGAVPQDFAGSAGSDINVRARNINLISSGGSVGSITDPLKISANATVLSSGAFDGGIVNIVANGDIGITQVAANSNYSGDLRVGLIASNSGDVLINVPGGNIYDASGQTAAQALTAAQVDAISQALHLTPLDGAQAAALATVTAFDNLMNKSIADYSRIFNKGSKQAGTFLLTSATTEIFRAAVSASLGHTASDAEVQIWANAQFGVFVLDANAIDVFRPQVTAALGHTASDIEVQAWANAKYNASVPTFYQAYGTGFATAAALTNALANYAAYAQLNGSGSVQNGSFVLTASGLLNYSAVALGATRNATYQLLTANGSLQNGVFVLTATGIVTVGQTALNSSDYATLRLLQSNGSVQNGVYAVTAAGLLTLAPSVLNSTNLTTFQQLTSSANSFMQAGVFTLTPAGIAVFRAAASASLNHTATDAEVQTYASGRYQTLSDSVRAGAKGQYDTLAAQVQGYANTQYTSLASQIQAYANTQFTSLQSTVVYSATPSVALLLLNSSGNVVNGSFVLSATGVLSYASAALTAANYAAFRSLVSNGSVQGGTFLLNQTGLMNTAQAALTADYRTFQSLTSTDNGTISSAADGTLTLTLNAAGIAAFRAAATAALGHAASDAEVRTYANAQYQTYAATVRASANGQYQGYATTIQTAANTQYQSFAQQIRSYYSAYTLADADIPILAQYALSGSTLAAFQSLYAKGTVTNGVFTLTAANVPIVASSTLGAAAYATFQTLYAQGALVNGVFKLSAAGVAAQAGTVLTPTYQSFLALGANGAVQYGTYQFNNAGISTYAQSGITAGYQNFQTLVSNGNVVNGALVLTAGGIINLRSAAAAALGIANPTDAQVQAYANAQYQGSLFTASNAQYQGYVQTVAADARDQYLAYVQRIADYFDSHPNFVRDPANFSLFAQGILGQSDYAKYQVLLNNGTAVLGTYVNDVYTGGSYTLNTSAAPTVAQQVLPTADYASYQAFIAKGTVQNGNFVLASSNVYQAFQQLASNGTFQNGAFAFTGAGIQSNAQSVLTNAFQQLTGYGSVQGSTFVLGSSGVSYYAPVALTAVNYTTYTGLTSSANGTISNGTLVLNANGLAAFRQAAAAALNISSPTDAQVQTYANGQYQAFTQTIQSYGNTQYQANAAQAQTAANTQYQTLAQTVAQYIQNQGSCFLCGGNNDNPPTDAQIAQNARQALTQTEYASFQALLSKGTVANGTLTLSAAGVQSYANDTAFQGQTYTTFQTLTSNGTLSNGTFALNTAALPTFAQAALDAASYQNYLTLRQNISFGYTLTGTDAANYASYNQRIQTYANTTYQSDLQTIQGYANAQYQTYAQTIQVYGASQYNTITAQIQAFANTQYQADVQTIQAYGASQYQTLNAAGTTPPPAGLQALVANFGWSTAQLASAIDRSALQPAVTTIGEGKANIVGRDVTLTTSGSVGTLAPNVVVDLNDLRNGTISDAQRAALAIATTPGSVTFDAIDSHGQLRTGLVLSSLPSDITVDMLTKAELKQTSPVFVNASGKFSATAGTAVYLQSTTTLPDNAPSMLTSGRDGGGTLTIGQITAGGDVTLQATQSIVAATSNGSAIYAVQIITANNGNLTMAAGQNIGSSANALAFRIAGNLVAASAGGGDLYVNSAGSGVNIGRVNAQGTASITSSGDIVGYLPGIAITGNRVVLNSQGNVGSSASPLSIKVGQGGTLSGTVSGSAYIYDQILVDPANPAQLVQDLTVGAFSAAAGLYLTAQAGIVIATSAVSANGPVSLTADTIVMNVGSQITSGGLVTIAGLGDVTLAHVQSTYNPASAAVVVSVSAGGSILSSDSIQTNIVASTANGLVSLVAFNDIGTLTHRVSFDATSLSATATNSGIAITGVTNLRATLLSAIHGNVDVVGNAVLRLDSVLAGTAANAAGTFTANATGAIVIGTATSRGSQVAHAGGDVTFTTLTANAGDVTVTSDSGKIEGTTINANGSATLTAATTNKGTTLTATNGSLSLTSGGLIDWTTLNAATTVDVWSTAGGVNVGTATSGGTQTIRGAQNVAFTTLTATGITGDAGDVLVTAGSIQGGSIAPAGLARLTATAGITGTGSIVSTELIELTAGGQINWATLDGKTVTVESTGGSATVGNATSRGTLTLLAKQDAGFTQLTTTGLAGDPSDVIVTTAEGAILGGSITSHGQAILTAGANLPLNSPFAANARIVSTGSITSSSLIALHARGQIDWETLNAPTTIDVTSTDGGARVGTATAGGSITMHGKQDVAFDQLTNTGIASDVTLTSDNGAILGGSITSDGALSLIAAGSITATGANGSGGALNWSVLRAGGSMFLRSLGDAITIDNASSGGSMTLWAKNNVTFRQLTTTGAGSNIILRSDEGAVIALGAGLVNVDAGGSVTIEAATSITGSEVRAGGSVAMTATNGRIGWNAISAGTSVNVRSSADVIDIATITSGGVQTLWAKNNVTFTQLTATAGGADITSSTGAIVGGSVNLGGATRMAAKTTISGTTATSTAGAMEMSAEDMITWNAVNAAGGSLTITSTQQTMNIPSLASGGKMTLDVAQDMLITQITTTGIPNDAGDVDVTSHTGRITGGTIAANGGIALNAPVSITGVSAMGATGAVVMNTNGLIDWATLNAGTQINVRSTGAGVNLGTATSGGSQTIRGAQDVNFATLTTNGITGDAGNVDVTSDNAFIQGTTVAANGSATLIAATTNKGTTLTTNTGSATLLAGGLIDWATLNAGTQINVRSTGAGVNLDTATSGGTQTIRGAQDVNFATLTTTGVTGDVGDVGVTSDTGLIQGTTVAANGSAILTAATTNKGTTLTTSTGSATLLAGGLIDWTNINAAKSFTAISTGGAINLGTANSGGSQSLHALNGVTFTKLTTTGVPGDQGNIAVISDQGSIRGVTVAANGDASFDGGASIDLGNLSAGSVGLSTPRDLTIGFLQVYRSILLAADTINVKAEQLQSNPPVPLHVTVTGYRGGVATSANLVIDPPEVIVDKLMVTDSIISVDSPKLTITDGYVPGQMWLLTPAGDILLDNRTPAPSAGANLQLYQPSGVFSMKQFGNANFSDTQVVYYDTTISSTIMNYGGNGAFTGSSFVRNAITDMKSGQGFDFASIEKSGLAAFYLLGLPGSWRIDAAQTPTPVEVIGDGPAVNIDGLSKAKKLHETRDRKTVRNRIRSTSLEQGDGTRLDFASTAR